MKRNRYTEKQIAIALRQAFASQAPFERYECIARCATGCRIL